MVLRRFLLALMVGVCLATLSAAGCGGTEGANPNVPEPGSANDPLKEAPKPERKAPPKNTPDPSQK